MVQKTKTSANEFPLVMNIFPRESKSKHREDKAMSSQLRTKLCQFLPLFLVLNPCLKVAVPLQVSKLIICSCLSLKLTSSEDDVINVFLFRLLLAGITILSEGGAFWVEFPFPWTAACSSKDSLLESSSVWKGGTINFWKKERLIIWYQYNSFFCVWSRDR